MKILVIALGVATLISIAFLINTASQLNEAHNRLEEVNTSDSANKDTKRADKGEKTNLSDLKEIARLKEYITNLENKVNNKSNDKPNGKSLFGDSDAAKKVEDIKAGLDATLVYAKDFQTLSKSMQLLSIDEYITAFVDRAGNCFNFSSSQKDALKSFGKEHYNLRKSCMDEYRAVEEKYGYPCGKGISIPKEYYDDQNLVAKKWNNKINAQYKDIQSLFSDADMRAKAFLVAETGGSNDYLMSIYRYLEHAGRH